MQNIIGPNDVVHAVQQFVNDRNERLAGGGGGARKGAAAAKSAREDELALAAAGALKGSPQEIEEREYWTRMAGVIGQPTFEVWKQLEKQMQSYNDVLSTRSNAIGEVKSLREQNMQLKGLLNQYLNAKVNDELIVPPTETIHLAMV